VDTLYTVRFREVLGLSSFKNFKNQTTDCGDIAYCRVGYVILSHPVVKLTLCFDIVNRTFLDISQRGVFDNALFQLGHILQKL